MDKSSRNYLVFSAVFIFFLILILVFLGFLYLYSSVYMYKYLLLIVITAMIIVVMLFMTSAASVWFACRAGRVPRAVLYPVKVGLKLLLPFIVFITGVFNGDKDSIRKYYIEINNLLVESKKIRCRPHDVLVLIPHCLQNSACEYKITADIKKCRRCGRCCIGEIVGITRDAGVKTLVVTGGTAARNAVVRENPRLVLSVACERDLMCGMTDVSIPVIGIANERPNGPCSDTSVNVELFRAKLKEFLE